MTSKVSPEGGISPKQQRFLAALIAGNPITVASRAAGITEKTAHQWLNQDAFKQALKTARHQAFDAALTVLQDTVEEAIGTLRSLMRDDKSPSGIRLRAAQILLEQSINVFKLNELEARIEAIEQSRERPL